MTSQPLSSLIVDVRPGERLALSGQATVELVHKSGQLVRLRVTAARDVQIKKGVQGDGAEPPRKAD